jgi:RHS repeat-associated protein
MFECPFPIVDWSPSFTRQYKPVSVHSASAYTGDYNELVYLRARYYASKIGRFLSKDTWDGNSHQPITYNLWNYVEANPVNYTDPTGHCSWTENNRINNAEKNVLPQANDSMTTYCGSRDSRAVLGSSSRFIGNHTRTL